MPGDLVLNHYTMEKERKPAEKAMISVLHEMDGSKPQREDQFLQGKGNLTTAFNRAKPKRSTENCTLQFLNLPAARNFAEVLPPRLSEGFAIS